MDSSKRSLAGIALAGCVLAVLTVAMIPVRAELSTATDGLVLVIPVVVGAVAGGFFSGVVSVVAGFLVYDLVFTPPYYTPSVSSAENLVAPAVYLVVMLLVARVFAGMDAARREARAQKDDIRKLEEVDHVATRLISAVSHDLRTPLAAIKMCASTLRDPEVELTSERQREFAELIDEQADRLTRLVTNLLNVGRIRAGALEPRRELVSLHDVVEEAVAALVPTVEPHRVTLSLPNALPLVDVDRLLIGQVVFNLVENAARHAPRSSPIVVSAREASLHTIEVSVVDGGPGVADSERAAVFGMFNRRDGDGGAGLGLSIAKAFLEAHGERIWVEDGPDGGAKFSFTLPAPVPLEYERLGDGTNTCR